MTDPDHNRIPLTNLAIIQTRLDSLSRHLTNSVNAHVILPPHHLTAISSELTSSIHHVILNATALLQPDPNIIRSKPDPNTTRSKPDPEIIEVDAVELLAEHVHVCNICGKGFKRDANLRMHMRAHGDKYKSPQSLAKPAAESTSDSAAGINNNNTRFSCPYGGCNRNKESPNFKALKSLVCVKNHFKRSHCPKKFKCERCNVKSFGVVADLRSHLRVCEGSEMVAVVEEEDEDETVMGSVSGVGVGSEFDDLLQGFIGDDSIDEFFRF